MNLSIIIPHYNDVLNLNKCISSIKKSCINFKHEIILVDDNSKNSNRKIIKKKKFKIKTYFNDSNMGPAYCRNLGVKKSKYKNILFLDSDVITNKLFFENLKIYLKNYNVMVGIYGENNNSKNLGSVFRSSFEFFFHYKDGSIREVKTFHSGVGIIKKSIFNKIKGFNEKIKYGMDYENEEIGLRITKFENIYLIPNLIVQHSYPSFIKILYKTFYRVKNFLYFNLKKKSDLNKNSKTNLSMAINSIISAFIFLNSIIVLFFPNNILLLTLSFLILINIYRLKDFYFYLLKKFKFKIIILYFYNITYLSIIFFGSAVGFLKYLLFYLKKKF